LEAVSVGSKKVRIVITGDSKMKALEEARKWVLQLEKEILEQRRNCRTRGLILLGTVLLGAISDEDVKFQIYEQFILNFRRTLTAEKPLK
jgi:hypothetical protein